MFNSIYDVIDEEQLKKNVLDHEKILRRDFANDKMYFYEYIDQSQYIMETIVSERWGWKAAGAILVEVYGMNENDCEDFSGDFIEWLSSQEWVYDEIEAMENNFNDQLRDFMRKENLRGNLFLTWYEGSYVLMYVMDEKELEYGE